MVWIQPQTVEPYRGCVFVPRIGLALRRTRAHDVPMIESLIGKTITASAIEAGCVTLTFTDGTRATFSIQPAVTLAQAARPPVQEREPLPVPVPDALDTAPVPASADKPPPTVLGVSGINDTTFGGAGAPSPEWVFLVNHPPFQMYVAAQIGTEGEPDAVLRCIGYVQQHMEKEDLAGLLDRYSSWFHSRGSWPNETPMGELVEH